MGLPEKIKPTRILPILSMDEKKSMIKKMLLDKIDELTSKGLYHKQCFRNAKERPGFSTLEWEKNYHYKELQLIRSEIYKYQQLLGDLK